MRSKTIRTACIGECMIELAHRSATDLQLGFGGDTLNTAIYLNPPGAQSKHYRRLCDGPW